MHFPLIFALIASLSLSPALSQIIVPVTRGPSPYLPQGIVASTLLNANNEIYHKEGFSQFNTSLLNYENIQYYGKLVAGSQNQTFTILFDSGSESLWFPSSECVGCPTDNRFNCDESETCVRTTNTDYLEYGSGEIAGTYVWEEVGLMPDGKINCSVLLVTEGKDLQHTVFDGILGLGSSSSPSNFIDLAYDQKVIKDKVFSFYLDTNPSYSGDYINYKFMVQGSSQDDDSDDNSTLSESSYLLVGFIPEDKVNNLFWLPVTLNDYWATDVIGLSVGDQPIDMTDDFRSRAAVFDSGTSLLALIPSVYNTLVQTLLDFSCMQQGHQVMTCRCADEDLAQYPNITFYTRGLEFNITARQYMMNPAVDNATGALLCGVGIENLDSMPGIGLQIIGDNFFRSNYVAFSKRNQTLGLEMTDKRLLRPVKVAASNYWTAFVGIAVLILTILMVNILEMMAHKQEMAQSLSGPNSPLKASYSPLKNSQINQGF